MNLSGKFLVVIVAILFLGAAIVEWKSFLKKSDAINKSRRIVLKTPIHFEHIISQPFTVDVAASYSINIKFHKTNLPPTAATNKLAIEVTITNDVGVLVCKSSLKSNQADENGSNYLTCKISTFKAFPKIHYHLMLNAVESSPIFEMAEPSAEISIESRAFENLCMATSILAYKAIGLALLSFLCLTILLVQLTSCWRNVSVSRSTSG